MKKTKKRFVMWMALSAIMLISSCATYQVSKDFNGQKVEADNSGAVPVAYIHAKNYGYYLFNTVPLISGDCEKVDSTSWFTDNVNPENSINLLTKKAKELGATNVTDISSTYRASGMYTLWIFWYRGAQSSGTAVK